MKDKELRKKVSSLEFELDNIKDKCNSLRDAHDNLIKSLEKLNVIPGPISWGVIIVPKPSNISLERLRKDTDNILSFLKVEEKTTPAKPQTTKLVKKKAK